MSAVAETIAPEMSVARIQSTARGTLLMSAGHAAGLVSNGLVHVIAARKLSTTGYGQFVIAFFFISWLASVVSAVVLPGLKKIVSEDHSRFAGCLSYAAKWYSLVILAITGLFLLSPPLLSALLGDEELLGLLMLAGAQVPLLAGISLSVQLLGGVRRFSNACAPRIIAAVSGGLAACGFLYLGWGATGAVLGLLIGSAAAACISLLLLLAERRRRVFTRYRPDSKRVLYWTAVTLPTTVGIRTLETMDIWMVKALLPDTSAAGLYATAYTVARLPLFVVHGLGDAVFPRVSQALQKGDKGLARSVARQAQRFVIVLLTPVCFIAAGAPREVITLVFSARYVAAGDCLVILAAGIFLAGLMHCSLRLIAAAGRPATCTVLTLGSLAFGCVCLAVLTPRYGIRGAAIASLVTFAVAMMAAVAVAHRLLGMIPPMTTVLRCLIAGGVVYVPARLLPVAGPLVIVKLAALGVGYFVILMVLRELRREDFAKIMRGSVN